jgi:hypothetical protein
MLGFRVWGWGMGNGEWFFFFFSTIHGLGAKGKRLLGSMVSDAVLIAGASPNDNHAVGSKTRR